MSRNGSGTYSLPSGNPVSSGTTISSTWANNTLSDIASALTQSVSKDGQTTWTGNMAAGGYKITGLTAGSAATDSATVAQVQAGAVTLLGSVGGTADVITATAAPAIAAYVAGQTFRFVAGGTNTGATTINLNGLGAKNITKNGTTALAAGDIVSGALVQIGYDGTQFQLSASSRIDTQPLVYDSADATKVVRLEASTMPTATTRTLYAGLPSSTKSGTYSLAEADYGGVIYCTSSWTLTLTTSLGAGFQVWVKNTGTGVITLAPTTGSLFFPGGTNAGLASSTLPYDGAGQGPYNVSGVLLQCDGTDWHVIATDEAHGEQLFTTSGSWVAPAGVTTIWLDGCGQGGGGGGVATNPGANAGGGGGGQSIVGSRYAVVPGTTYTVTLANTGGVGGPNGSTNGTAGSNAVFGALVTLTGGSGGTSSTGGSFTAGGAAGGAGGGAGGGGSVVSGSTATGGTGGGTHWGQGGVGQIGTQNGLAASGYGAGGGGAVTATGSTQTGGAGSAGFFRVRW